MSLYISCAEEAVTAFHQGNHRLSATKYLQSFLASPDKWDPNRWQIFHGYTSILQEEYFKASDSDLEALQRTANDKNELKLYRCEATFTLGLLIWIRNDRDEAAATYLNVQRLAEKAKKQERRFKVMATIPTPDGNRVAGIGMTPMGELMDGIATQARDNLQQMQKTTFHSIGNLPARSEMLGNRLRSDGTPMPPARRTTAVAMGPVATELTKEQIKHLLQVGGDRCDCCQKTREDFGGSFRCCTSCMKAYYCDRECQVKQWKAGHKKYCRKPGEFKVGDHVRLNGLASKPEMNGLLVTMISPDSQTEGRWEVRIPGGDKSVSIATEKIEQLRPLK